MHLFKSPAIIFPSIATTMMQYQSPVFGQHLVELIDCQQDASTISQRKLDQILGLHCEKGLAKWSRSQLKSSLEFDHLHSEVLHALRSFARIQHLGSLKYIYSYLWLCFEVNFALYGLANWKKGAFRLTKLVSTAGKTRKFAISRDEVFIHEDSVRLLFNMCRVEVRILHITVLLCYLPRYINSQWSNPSWLSQEIYRNICCSPSQ